MWEPSLFHLRINMSFFKKKNREKVEGNGDLTSRLRLHTTAHPKLTSTDSKVPMTPCEFNERRRSPAACFDCCQLPINTYGMLIRPQRSATPPDFSDPPTTSAFITTRAHARSAYASCMGAHKEPPLGFRSWTCSCGMWIWAFGGHVLMIKPN